MDASTVDRKKQIAAEVTIQLQQIGIHFNGSTILDVGFGFGFNAAEWTKLGATVFGVEPDKGAYAWAVQQNKISPTNALCSKLQDVPSGWGDQFDVATVLLWEIPRSEYDVVLSELAKRVVPGGIVVIGIQEEKYIFAPDGVAVQPHAEWYFGNVQTIQCAFQANKYLLLCKDPDV